MPIIMLMFLVSVVFWQGCNQGHTSANKEANFEEYVNNAAVSTNATINEQSNAIVNVAF